MMYGSSISMLPRENISRREGAQAGKRQTIARNNPKQMAMMELQRNQFRSRVLFRSYLMARPSPHGTASGLCRGV
jgi:hypothetical protein